MSLFTELGEISRFFLRQSAGFLEIFKLKIRIIGFSNKRSGVMTRLGEVTHKAVLEGRLGQNDELIQKFSAEAKAAEVEISASEQAINAKRGILKEDWDIFKSRFRDVKTPTAGDGHGMTVDNRKERHDS